MKQVKKLFFSKKSDKLDQPIEYGFEALIFVAITLIL